MIKDEVVALSAYTPVRQAGDFLYVSGQVGVDPATKIASPYLAPQVTQALKNLQSALEAAHASLDDVVKTTIFLVNMDDFPRVNALYEQFFDTPRPARSTVGVTALPRVAGSTRLLIEIEAVAYKEQ
jgi:2-iminobutanoate/2-iminopropanoate deaminase